MGAIYFDVQVVEFQEGIQAVLGGQVWLDGIATKCGIDLADEMRISEGTASDHDGMAVGFFYHADGIVVGEDIAAADDGDFRFLDQLGNQIPISCAGESLVQASGV